MGGHAKLTSHQEDLCIAISPVVMWIPMGVCFKKSLLFQLLLVRRIIMVEHTNTHYLLKYPITLSNDDLVELLLCCKVKQIVVKGFAQKSSLEWGVNKIMHSQG